MAEEEKEAVGNRSPWPLIVLFGLIFLPGGILAGIQWGMLRWGRLRPSVIGMFGAIIAGISILVGFLLIQGTVTGVEELVAKGSLDGERILELALNIVPIWICLSLVLGAPVGWGFSIYSARQMKNNPHLTQLAGSWRYNFEYRRTPAEYFRREKNIRKLKNALFVENDKAPMGLDEKTDEVVFRYDTEARKHTFMTGASGSGKAIHADTWIATQDGFKTAGRVRVGDTLFDEQGNPTKVTAKYQPKTPDHYRITLSNGEMVKACGDHLWTVKETGGSMEAKTLATREIAKNPEKYYISALKKPVLGTDKPMVNTKLLGAWLASGALDHGRILKKNSVTKLLQEDYDSFIDDLQKMGWLDSDGSFRQLHMDFILTSIPARERVLEGATTVAGSYGVDGQTKMTLPALHVAEYLQSIVFSLGLQATKIEDHGGAYVFRFTNTRAVRQKTSAFSMTIGELSRKKAPTRNLIKFETIEEIDDNPDDYFCFTVDSPSHLFLIGKTFTPTHNTITMQNLIYADIETGKDVVVIDFKRSPKFASKLAAWAEDNGREFYHFVNGDPKFYDIPRSKGQCYYDPLKSGTPTSKADMVLGMREYDAASDIYKSYDQQLIQGLFNMFEYADRNATSVIDWNHGGITLIASTLSGNGLGELIAANSVEVPPGTTPSYPYRMPGAGGIEGSKVIAVNSPSAKEAIEIGEELRAKGGLANSRAQLAGRIRTIVTSEYGRWMKTGNSPNDREIDLYKMTEGGEGNVILFSLNSDSEPEFAKFVGSMIFSDLTNISALRRNSGASNQVNIYVDEFQAVPPTAVTSLLEKSRESRMALTLAQQSFDQVVASAPNAGEAYLNSILDTCSNFIAHAGATEKSATRLAEILGKEYVTVYSKMNDNDSSFLSVNWAKNEASKVSSREEERWKFAPAEFMGLSSPDPGNGYKSSAVWITKTSSDPKYSRKGGATARAVWMIPADNVLVEYYDESKVVTPRPERPVKSENITQVEEPVSDAVIEDSFTHPLTKKVAVEPVVVNKPQPQPIPSPLPPEDDDTEDEEWSFEDVPDDELDDETSDILSQENQTSSLDDLFGGAAAPSKTPNPPVEEPKKSPPPVVAPVAPPRETPTLPKMPAQKPTSPNTGLPTRPGGGLPLRPGGGLPTRPQVAPKNDSDEISLPEL